MRLVFAIFAALALSGCVVLETRPAGSYYQYYQTEPRFVGYDEWGRAVYDTRPVARRVVVETVVVPVVVGGRRHDSRRHYDGRRHGHRH